MRITNQAAPDLSVAAAVPVTSGGEVGPGPVAGSAAELQSAVLQPALQALRDLPDFDQAKVEALRAALANGEVPFDAGKLAGLIERYYGNRG